MADAGEQPPSDVPPPWGADSPPPTADTDPSGDLPPEGEEPLEDNDVAIPVDTPEVSKVLSRRMSWEPEIPPDRHGRPRVRKSERPTQRYQDQPIITRLHVLEFLNQKEWWYEGQNALCFTLVLWVIFIYIMYTRGGITQSYDLHLSVMQHMEQIVAHPHLSGIRMRAVEDDPLPCRCACQSSSAGMPKGPCDSSASELIDFVGQLKAGSPRLLHFNNAALLSAKIDPVNLGDKLGAGNDDIAPMTWDKISQPEDVWFWIEHGFIPDVWKPRSMQVGNETLQGLVAQKNLIIGGVRLRQKRAKWSPVCEDKVSADLSTMYRTDCRSSEDATGPFGPLLAATLPTDPNASGAPVTDFPGHAYAPSSTSDEKGVYDGLFDVELNISDALETATACRKYNWLDGATRSLSMQSVTLNAQIGMFALIDIKFNFPPGGGVEKKVRVHTIHAVGSKIEFMDIIPELMWAGMIVLLLRQEITQMCMSCWHRKCLDYWLDMWCVVDWISIFCGVLITMFWLWQMTSIGIISDNVAALPRAPFASGPPADISAYRTQWQAVLDDASDVYVRKQYYQLCLFWYTLILTSRFLKGFLSQAKLAMLQMTIGTTFWDLCHLLIFFATLFLNFQLGGHILFGSELEEWSTMVNAGATATRMMLGSYEFAPMYEIAPVSATCWFWGFLLSMAFILLNLIFAMVADYFHVIRESIGDTDSLWDDTRNSVRDLFWRVGWRKINFSDGEYKSALCENPYNEVAQGLMDTSEVPAQMERDAGHTCLGVRLGRRHMEAMSVEGLTKDSNKGCEEATSKGIQAFGADIMAADHLLELAYPHVEQETRRKNESQLAMVRHFVSLLRNHRAEMDAHCTSLEAEVTDDHGVLTKNVDYLESSVTGCLEEFERLKREGVHSLAPPHIALPRPGTFAAREAQQQSLVAPGAILRAIELDQSKKLRNTSSTEREPPSPQVALSAMLMNQPNAAALAMSSLPALADGRGDPIRKSPKKRGADGRRVGVQLGDQHGGSPYGSEHPALPAPSQPAALRDAGQTAEPDSPPPPALMDR